MNKKCASKLFMLILIVLFSITGCTTKIKSGGPFDSVEDCTGLKYYLPVNVLVVETTKTTTITNSLNKCLEIDSNINIIYDIKTLEFDIIPDFNKIYTVEIKHGSLSADTIAIKRTNKQLLKQISVDSTGKTADVAVNALKAVASIAGAAYGLNITPALSVMPDSFLTKQDKENGLAAPGTEDVTLCNWINILENKNIKNPGELTYIQALTLIKYSGAISLFTRIENIKSELIELESRRTKLNKELYEATSEQDVKTKRARVKDNEDHIDLVKSDLDSATLALNSLVQRYSDELMIGKNEKVETIKEIFKVDELPTTVSLYRHFGGKISNNVGKEISDSFNRLGFAITIDWLKSETLQAKSETTNGDDSPKSYIYYRDTIPAILTFHNRENDTIDFKESDGTNGNSVETPDDLIKKATSEIDNLPWKPYQKYQHQLFSANSQAARVPYKTSYVGKRKIVLDFTDSGLLTDISFESTASADILAEKTSKGVTESISSFSTALGNIKDIQASKAAIISSQLESRLNTLKSQKEILDAEIALKGAYADVDLLKKQAHLKNQLEYYKALSESIKAGNTAAVAEAMSEINIESGKLSAISEYINALKGASTSSIENISQIQALKEQIIGLQSQIGSNPDNELLQTQIETLQLQLTILQKLLEVQQSKLN